MSVSAFRRVFCISPSLPSATLPIHLFFSSVFLILLSIWPQTRTRKPINSYDPIFHVFFTSASSSSGNRNKSNTEASELYYAARLRPQRRPLYSNNNNREGGGAVWKRRVVRDGSPTEQSNAADKSIILTWPRTRRATYLSFEVASTFCFCFYSVFAYLVLFFVYVSVFASVQKFPPSAGWKWTRSKAITSTQLPKAVNVKHSGFKTIAQGVGTSYGNIKARNLLKYFKQNLSCF